LSARRYNNGDGLCHDFPVQEKATMALMDSGASARETSYSSRTSRARLRRRWCVALGLLALIAWGPFRFSYFSVCSKCGCIRDSVARQLPFLPVTYWTSHRLEDSPVSRAAAQLVQPHSHEWLFGQGGGNGVLCALGPGHQIAPTVWSEQVASFIRATHEYVAPSKARYWLNCALDPKRSRAVLNWLQASGFPASAPVDRKTYSKWRERANLYLPGYDELAAPTPTVP